MRLSDSHKTIVAFTAALLIGIAFPLLPLGIALTQGILGLALILLLSITPFSPEARKTYHTIFDKPLTYALGAMFVLWFFVTPWSNGPSDSFTTVLRTSLYLLGSAFIWAHFVNRPDLHRVILKTLMVSSLIILICAAAALFFPAEIWQQVQQLTNKTTGASRHFKAFASALLCLIPVLIWAGHRLGNHWHILTWAMMPAILYVMIETRSRSSISGVIAMVIVIGATLAWAHSKLAKAALSIVALVISAGLAWIWFLSRTFAPAQDLFLPPWLIDPHRQVIWQFTFEKFLESPWAGHGVNRINFVSGANEVRADIGGAYISSHPHNWVLEILSETGVFGLSAILIVLGLLAWRLLVHYKSTHDHTSLALMALCAGFFSSSLFNFSIWSTWWLLTFFVLFAIVSAGRSKCTNPSENKKILFVANEDWAFCSHRIPSALAAQQAGFEVVVTARENQHRQMIEAAGFRFVPWHLRRKSLNPLHELFALFDLIRIFDRERPDVAYNVTIKPILYGSIAARFSDTPNVINLFSGLGTWFGSSALKLQTVRTLILPVLRRLHNHAGTWLMIQNSDDQTTLEGLGIAPFNRTVLVPGSGLDTDEFTPQPEPKGPMSVIFLSRMLWDKGIAEIIEAARLLKDQGSDIRIIFVGEPDTENPNHVPQAELKKWHDEGLIEWWGKRSDIQEVWGQAHVALLPSYREGMPRSLLEGAACARPLVATDSPGCRDLVQDGINGLLVPLHDGKAIADALQRLNDDPALRQRLGQNARKMVVETYSTQAIAQNIKDLLKKI